MSAIEATHYAPSTGRLSKVCPTCLARYPEDFRVCPRDAHELEDVREEDQDAFVGTIVGETFEILRPIGEGGMARVYEARHVRLPNRRFAVKVLHPEYAAQPSVVVRFQREAEAASGIGHPNIVDVYDVGRARDGTPYMVSELLNGRDFSAFLDEHGSLEPGAAVHIVRQVCRALSAAHDAGVVHRDIKPHNIFLVGDPTAPIVKVLDFGISKFDDASGGVNLTQTGMIMGTPGYIPPEQARGAKTDHRADIYGVGAMLYRAVTGRLPFDSEDPSEVLGMVLTMDPPRPRSLVPALPEVLELVIQRAMAKDPADRYATMHDLDDALAPFDPDQTFAHSLLPPPPGSTSRVTPTPRSSDLKARSNPDSTTRVSSHEVRMARPNLVLITPVAYAWLMGCVVEMSMAGFRLLFRRGQALNSSDKILIVVVVAALSITPAIFWLRSMVRSWNNSVHALALARLLQFTFLAAMIPYAFVTLGLRLAGPSVVEPISVFAPPAASLLVAFASYLMFGRRLSG